MLPVDAVVREVVQQKQRPAELGVDELRILLLEVGEEGDPLCIFLVLADFSQHFELVHCRLRVRFFTSLDLESHVLFGSLLLH